MKRKNIIWILCALVVVLAIVGLLLWRAFYGNGVRSEREIFIGSRTDYAGVLDSLRPTLRHPRAFRRYAAYLDLSLIHI